MTPDKRDWNFVFTHWSEEIDEKKTEKTGVTTSRLCSDVSDTHTHV